MTSTSRPITSRTRRANAVAIAYSFGGPFTALRDFQERGERVEYPVDEGGGNVDLEALFGSL